MAQTLITDLYQSYIGLSTAQKDCSREIWSETKGREDGRSSWHMDTGWKEEPTLKQVESPEGTTACEESMFNLSIFVFLKDCIPWEKTDPEQGGSWAGRRCGEELFWTSHSCPCCPGGGVRILGEGAQCSWWEREAKTLQASFVTAPHYLSLIDSKLHLFPSRWVCFTCSGNCLSMSLSLSASVWEFGP